MCGVDSHGLDKLRSLGVEPDGNDDEFGEFKVWGSADEFRCGPERRREVLHDARDVVVGDNFELFVERYGASGVRYGLIYE